MEKITINKYRNVDNGSLRLSDVGKIVKLAGWVDTIRKLGELTFVVLRDTYGKTQIVLNKEFIPLNKEDVISVEGKVIERESKNPNMPTCECRFAFVQCRVYRSVSFFYYLCGRLFQRT